MAKSFLYNFESSYLILVNERLNDCESTLIFNRNSKNSNLLGVTFKY